MVSQEVPSDCKSECREFKSHLHLLNNLFIKNLDLRKGFSNPSPPLILMGLVVFKMV